MLIFQLRYRLLPILYLLDQVLMVIDEQQNLVVEFIEHPDSNLSVLGLQNSVL